LLRAFHGTVCNASERCLSSRARARRRLFRGRSMIRLASRFAPLFIAVACGGPSSSGLGGTAPEVHDASTDVQEPRPGSERDAGNGGSARADGGSPDASAAQMRDAASSGGTAGSGSGGGSPDSGGGSGLSPSTGGASPTYGDGGTVLGNWSRHAPQKCLYDAQCPSCQLVDNPTVFGGCCSSSGFCGFGWAGRCGTAVASGCPY
jgi:hypothetical protein